ncbi:hypothetical protein CXB51_003172 [Gossypium anomalum]|uniref:Cation efflux protein transmembrane domain-containing protein n=1 Tax=Gossypium anomalum TaxID=47600 RepID=A0A8J6DAE6_9ROSI|nr:hypothetical protein CXB51_003172 [Gossypium anomalum]
MNNVRTPLLSTEEQHIKNGKIEYSKSINALKHEFFSKLPDKVRAGLPEIPFHINLSKTTCLIEGEKEYYEKQFAMLRSFEEVDSLKSPNAIDEAQDPLFVHISVPASKTWLIGRLIVQIYAIIKSGSLAVAASTLDSLLDLLAGGILWFTNLSMKTTNIYKYPIGKLRVQPVGISIFAAVMATLATGMSLYDHADSICSENCPMFYCRSSGSKIVRAYAKDHYFYVVTNLVGLIAAVLGDKFYWWIDPAGALILALYTITNWSGTVLENAVSLVGQSAPPEVLQKLTYLVLRHHLQIKRVDTVRAYTFGVLFFVELYKNQVDIQLPEDLPLKEAHAIGESLQIKFELLQEVEPAFVHLDFECRHKPEHSVLIRLPATQP